MRAVFTDARETLQGLTQDKMSITAEGFGLYGIPDAMLKGLGGAMDLVSGVKKIIIMMDHSAKDGSPKGHEECGLLLTSKNVVDLRVTDLGVFEVDAEKGLKFFKLAPESNL